MRRDALDAGSYLSAWTGLRYPRLQILTIEDLLRGEPIKMPPTGQAPGATAPRVRPAAAVQGQFEV